VSTFWFGLSRQWRGVVLERTLFGPVIRLGWMSFGASKYDPPDFIKEWHSALQRALEKVKPANGKGQQK